MSGPIPPPPSIVTADGSRIIIAGTPGAGQVPTADGPNAAHWAAASGAGPSGVSKLTLNGATCVSNAAAGTGASAWAFTAPAWTLDRNPWGLGVNTGPDIALNNAAVGGFYRDEFSPMVAGWYHFISEIDLGFAPTIVPSSFRYGLTSYNAQINHVIVPQAKGTDYPVPGMYGTFQLGPIFEPGYATGAGWDCRLGITWNFDNGQPSKLSSSQNSLWPVTASVLIARIA